MKRFLIAAAASLSLSGCTPALMLAAETAGSVIAANTAAPTTDNRVIVAGTQGLIVAHNAYQGAAAVAEAAVRAGLVTGDKLNQLEKLNNEAKYYLDQADRGKDVAANVARVFNLIPQIRALAGR